MKGNFLLKVIKILCMCQKICYHYHIISNFRYKKNIERKKQKPGHDPYDADDDPLAERDVLSKYNEEIDGEKVESFAIGKFFFFQFFF